MKRDVLSVLYFLVVTFFIEAQVFDLSNHAHRKLLKFEEGKRTVLFFHSEQCFISRKLKEQMNVSEVKRFISQNFIVKEVDFDVEESLAMDFSVSSTPVLIFFRSNGREYFRRDGFWSDLNGERFRKEMKFAFDANSDIDERELQSLLEGGLEEKKSMEILDILMRRGVLSDFFKGMKRNSFKDRASFYLRAEAYFKLQKIKRAKLFYFYAFFDEIENYDSHSRYRFILEKYISRFRDSEPDEYFFALIESLIEKYPENYNIILDYSLEALKTGRNLQKSLDKLRAIPKEKLESNYYFVMARIMRTLGDCAAIEKLQAENEIDRPYLRAITGELESCQAK